MLRGDVDQSVVAAASHTPFESAWRVFVLERADTMDDPAANTLLKTLEEPPRLRRACSCSPTARRRCCRRSPRAARACASTRRRPGGSPSAWSRAAWRPPRRARARGSSLGDGERALALALGDGPALRARAEAFARAALRGEVGTVKPWTEVLARRAPPATAAEAELEQALADRARVPAQEGAPAQADRVHRARPPRRAARRDRRARPRAAARRPVVPRPRLPGRRRRGARAHHATASSALREDARDAPALHTALELVEDTRARLPFNVSLRPRAAGARLPARAHARGRVSAGMTEVRVRGAYATVRGPGIEDDVAVEEPLEIRVDGAALAVTMRTPGDDEELALGFLHGEGLIDAARPAGPTAELEANIVEVDRPAAARAGLRAPSTPPPPAGSAARARSRRSRCTRSACRDGPPVDRALLAALPDRLRQPTFERTGGLHATGLFTARRRAPARARGRRPPQRDGQGDRPGAARRARAAARPCAVRLGPAELRAGAEGGGGGRARAGRRRAPSRSPSASPTTAT